MSECLFCSMASGAMQVERLYEDDLVFSIRDINPRAPVHFMVIPKEHITSARETTEAHGPLLGRIFTVANTVAGGLGLAEKGFRLTINVGRDGGQTIDHLHLHVLGGRKLGPEG